MTWHNGEFLAVRSDGRRLFVHRSGAAADLFGRPARCVYRPPRGSPGAHHLWAPELHRLDGRWYIYYAADDGTNRSHRIWVLEACGDDPGGKYTLVGQLNTGGWAIDATLLHGEADEHYVVWSGWERQTAGPQNLYVAPLRDAPSLVEPRVLLTRPTRRWERHGASVCEGPAVLRRGGVTCIVYSASASWTTRSCLGMLVHRGGSYLDPGAWTKIGPVFAPTPEVWGVGHCSLVRDPLNGEDLIFYHAKTRRRRGWRDRNIRAQSFTWGDDGLPSFGTPLPLVPAGGRRTGLPGLSGSAAREG